MHSAQGRRWCLGLAGLALLVLAANGRTPADTQEPPQKKAPEQKKALKRNARERLILAQRGYDEAVEMYRQTQRSGQTITPWVNVDDVYIWSRRWMRAECEVHSQKDGRVAAHEAHLKRMARLEKLARVLRDSGLVTKLEPLSAEYYRLEAEGWLAEEKQK